jgi:hypothetical protein
MLKSKLHIKYVWQRLYLTAMMFASISMATSNLATVSLQRQPSVWDHRLPNFTLAAPKLVKVVLTSAEFFHSFPFLVAISRMFVLVTNHNTLLLHICFLRNSRQCARKYTRTCQLIHLTQLQKPSRQPILYIV